MTCKPYSGITLENGTHVKTVKMTLNIFAVYINKQPDKKEIFCRFSFSSIFFDFLYYFNWLVYFFLLFWQILSWYLFILCTLFSFNFASQFWFLTHYNSQFGFYQFINLRMPWSDAEKREYLFTYNTVALYF